MPRVSLFFAHAGSHPDRALCAGESVKLGALGLFLFPQRLLPPPRPPPPPSPPPAPAQPCPHTQHGSRPAGERGSLRPAAERLLLGAGAPARQPEGGPGRAWREGVSGAQATGVRGERPGRGRMICHAFGAAGRPGRGARRRGPASRSRVQAASPRDERQARASRGSPSGGGRAGRASVLGAAGQRAADGRGARSSAEPPCPAQEPSPTRASWLPASRPRRARRRGPRAPSGNARPPGPLAEESRCGGGGGGCPVFRCPRQSRAPRVGEARLSGMAPR